MQGGQTRPEADVRAEALSWAGQPNHWTRALWGALVAGALGGLLTLGSLAEGVSRTTNLVGWQNWDSLANLLVSFRFPLYGLMFGFLFPFIPGTTGLSKGVRYLAVLAVSEATVLLVPYDPAFDTTAAVTLRLVQVGAVCLALGVGGDLLTLRRIGVGMSGLRDIYHTSALVVWSSGVIVAVATAAATAALGAAANLMLERILPPPPPPQTQSSTLNAP